MTTNDTTASTRPTSAPSRPPAGLVARILVTQALLALLTGVAFLVFYAGLQRDPQPHGLPLAVAGSSTARLAEHALGATADVREVPDAAGARAAVRARTAVAGLAILGGSAVVYVAAPNGLAENAAAEALGRAVARAAGARSATDDLIPLVRFDPRALASFYIVLGVTVGAFILGQALYALRALAGLRAQLITVGVFAVAVAAVAATVVGPLLRVTPLPWPALVPLLALQAVAVATTTRALTAWLDAWGITLATLAMTAIGLSTSGGIIGPDLLPGPLATLGAILPPGAGLRALVSIAYFGGAQSAIPLLVLGAWGCAGCAGMVLHARLRATAARRPPGSA